MVNTLDRPFFSGYTCVVNRILLFIIFFALPIGSRAELDDLPSQFELSLAPPASPLQNLRVICTKVSEKAFFYSIATLFKSASIFSRVAGTICPPLAKECLMLSELCDAIAKHSFVQILKTSASALAPYQSWHLNKRLLSQIRANSSEEKELLHFLEKRWLAKSSGIHSWLIDWIFPSFRISVQAHPETGDYYARIPVSHVSDTYKKRMLAWKERLPQPLDFPLMLTRPYQLQDYLPSCIEVAKEERHEESAARCLVKLQETDTKVFVDLTAVLPPDRAERREWKEAWRNYQTSFVQAWKGSALNLNDLLFVQRMEQEGIGGIRLLPMDSCSSQERYLQEQFLLEWVSRFGLSVNRVELDHGLIEASSSTGNVALPPLPYAVKKEFASFLNSIDKRALACHPQKHLMLKGTIKLLHGLLDTISKKEWKSITSSLTKSTLVQLSFFKIKQQLELLQKQGNKLSFFDTASHIELIHADLTALLEIFSPFEQKDFAPIYERIITFIPTSLKPLTSYSLHSSGMTSLAGVFKAVEKSVGKTPRILFGENTYYECINTSLAIGDSSSVEEATDEDYKEVDLLLVQFNPVLKRITKEPTNYQLEKVADTLHRCLNAKREKPLTVAIDCTIDFIQSPHVKKLLSEFAPEIEKGLFNIICYRSGLKYDLFGMDNYCGAPFFMIHNEDPKWNSFDPLLYNSLLQTDRLSANWFCLAYQHASSELDLYRKEIFDNTRALLDKLSGKLVRRDGSCYYIVPIKADAQAGFVDFKIAGPLHYERGCAFVMGSLLLKCLTAGHPIFCRSSLGFYHSNFTVLPGEKYTTVRLTLGLDPAEVQVIAECFQGIDTLN